MVEISEINRKYARFPAFSDTDGVKLQPNATRKPFTSKEPWILTDLPSTPAAESTASTSVDFTESEQLRTRRRTTHVSKSLAKRYGHSIAQQDELKKHREQLPDYGKKPVREETKTGKVKLFGSYTRQVVPKVETVKKEPVVAETETKTETKMKTPFVPTFTPESLIPDRPNEEAETDALLAGLKKSEAHYLLFEEDTDYAEKKPEDKTVKRFNKQETVAMTRGQYKAAIKSKDKKKSVLDRKLSGMIAEGQSEQNSDRHFE